MQISVPYRMAFGIRSDLCRRSLKLHVPSDQFLHLVAIQPSVKLLVNEVFILPLCHSLYANMHTKAAFTTLQVT